MAAHGELASMTRRDLFRMATIGGAILGGVAGGGFPAAHAQSTLAPDDALKLLMDGNARFRTNKLTSFQDDLMLLAQKTAEKQEPFAAVLSCADSRVPVEIVFDQSIGHVFVVRVAGNVATPEIIASLERRGLPLVVKWDASITAAPEENRAGESTGIHLLDDFFASRYRLAERFGAYDVLEPRPAS